MTMVRPVLFNTSRRSIISFDVAVSRFPVGSSANSKAGSFIIALHIVLEEI